MFFIDVILPIPLKQTFTYSVNKDEAAFLQPGMRVAIPFGKSKVFTGIVYQVHDQAPVGYETKSIDHILDETPIITIHQLKHWEWIAKYYMCSLGEVIKAALPSAFLLESETMIKLSTEINIEEKSLTDEEFLVFEALQNQTSLHINEVRSILDKKNVVSVINKLIDKKVVDVEETVYELYTPKLVRYVKLSPEYTSEENLRQLLDSMSRAPKQREMLMNLFVLSSQTKKPITTIALQKKSNASASTLKSLIDKGVLEEYFIQKDRVEFSGEATTDIKELSEAQTKAYQEIKATFAEKDVVLLHGVTSSGKTEIYVRLIEQMIATGKQVLYMLPEIALTTQLITRLQKYFGEKISVYHSKFSVNERVEVWNNVLNEKSKAQVVIGARSSLFLPFKNLGFIIVDEEHEPSFKQYSPSPRYNARDSSIVLAKLHKAKVLMGSATPSLESYYNAKTGKFGLVTLKKRFGNVLMPEIELVDIKDKSRKKQMTGHFSDRLLEEMRETLGNGEQVILFQNRRGYSPVVECTTCGVSPQCPNCDVSLTFHQYKNQLRCHYCGYKIAMMLSCIACGSETLDTKGFGTEQVENELKPLFPNHKIARMDQDTTRGKHAYSKLIEALENEEIDILVGTQMLAKGLDFRNIGLVGVMNADNLLNFPDFRAHERSFQLLQQVSGRAGRTQKRGKVLIQTYNPYHQILKQVSVNDYAEMYKEQLEERYNFKYPPYYRTIKIVFKDKNLKKVQKASAWFAQALQFPFKENVLGPEPPPIGRIKNMYIINVLIKIPKDQSLDKSKKYINNVQRSFNTIKDFSSVRINIDVDNY
ncbi:primosomal protein N' [Aequorivita sp. 609]|uniref:replication restart helicase PriA n=1 Tax=Aequorivita TaxID=153265 RepID=UPI00161CE2EE|nr:MULTISPECIES: primosomal protein N' [Aequorivita]MBB6680999.1 primosomal protein N' [Aequorivita sp. 609]